MKKGDETEPRLPWLVLHTEFGCLAIDAGVSALGQALVIFSLRLGWVVLDAVSVKCRTNRLKVLPGESIANETRTGHSSGQYHYRLTFFNWYRWQLRGLQILVDVPGNNFLHQLFLLLNCWMFVVVFWNETVWGNIKIGDIPWRSLREGALSEPQHTAPKKQMPICLN